MASSTICQGLEQCLLEITLNRPDCLNAFNEEMHIAFQEALKRAHEDKGIRAVLITGNGRGFCAGQDLGDRNPATMNEAPDLEHTISTFYNPAVRLIRNLNKPVVCAVNGVAAGAGANIAFGCDIVLASEKARFIQSFAKVGLVPDAGGSWLLPRLIGEMRAKALAFTAEPLSPSQAKEWGLVWEVVPADELMTKARELARSLAHGPTFGLGLTKSAIQSAAEQSFDKHLELEAKYQGEAGRSHDYAEGVTAFLNKRSPDFRGN